MFVAGAVAIGVALAACSDDPDDAATTTSASTESTGSTGTTAAPATTGAPVSTAPADTSAPDASAPAGTALPAEIQAIMDQPRYADATWSLLVTDVESGETSYSLERGPDVVHRFDPQAVLGRPGARRARRRPPHRRRRSTASARSAPTARSTGTLALVGSGDLVFGGRRIDSDTVQITTFDHNDANGLGTAILSPQDPLYALEDLAAQVRAAGITAIDGEVVIDHRLFEPYRVPNGNLLITPVLLNENMVDVSVTPTEAGQPATVTHRPETAAFAVDGTGHHGRGRHRRDGRAVGRQPDRMPRQRRVPRHGVGRDPGRLRGTAVRGADVRRDVPGRGPRRLDAHGVHRGARPPWRDRHRPGRRPEPGGPAADRLLLHGDTRVAVHQSAPYERDRPTGPQGQPQPRRQPGAQPVRGDRGRPHRSTRPWPPSARP